MLLLLLTMGPTRAGELSGPAMQAGYGKVEFSWEGRDLDNSELQKVLEKRSQELQERISKLKKEQRQRRGEAEESSGGETGPFNPIAEPASCPQHLWHPNPGATPR